MTAARRDPTILFALLVALGVHLALIGFGVRAARRDLGWWLAGPPAPPATAQPAMPNQSVQDLGDHDTRGTSINSSSGEQPMESAVADARQEQAAMQRDPAGFGGKGSNRQLEQTLRGDNGDNSPRGSRASASSASAVFGSREASTANLSPQVASPHPLKSQSNAKQKPVQNGADPLSTGPLPVDKPSLSPANEQGDENPSQPRSDNQPAAAPQSPAGSQSAGGAGGKAGAPDSGAGNPIPTSDFESFPVTHIASRFLAGRIEARTGRKMRTRELPRLGLAAYADLQTLERPFVVMLLKIDTTGNVVDVRITHSSGSDNVDLPCQRAAYTWWFEPLKDPQTGQIHPEQIEFTVFF
jgi:hypothetical protein